MGRRVSVPEYEEQTGDLVGRVMDTKGGHIFSVETEPVGTTADAILPNRFRNVFWIRRGSLVVLRKLPDATEFSIVHILDKKEVKEMKRVGRWPNYFTTTNSHSAIPETDDNESEEFIDSDSSEE